MLKHCDHTWVVILIVQNSHVTIKSLFWFVNVSIWIFCFVAKGAFNTHFEGTFEDVVIVELRKLDDLHNGDSHFVWADNNKLATYFDVTIFPYVNSVNNVESTKWPLMRGAIQCHCKRVFFNCLLANMLIIQRAELPPLNEETGFHCIINVPIDLTNQDTQWSSTTIF